MVPTSRARYFDLSTLLAFGIATLLLVSLPGGCGDGSDDVDEGEPTEVAEPTAPPMMEVVEAEPGIINQGEADDGDVDEEQSEPDEDQSETEEPPAQETTNDGTYVVQAGDTLYEIAVRLNVTVEALLEANGISDANALQVGQELQVPGQN